MCLIGNLLLGTDHLIPGEGGGSGFFVKTKKENKIDCSATCEKKDRKRCLFN